MTVIAEKFQLHPFSLDDAQVAVDLFNACSRHIDGHNDTPTDPVLPKGIKIEPINIQSELRDAVAVRETIFKDHWGYVEKSLDELMEQWHHFIKSDKDFDPTLWFLSKPNGQIAEFCRCSGKMIEDPHIGWVNELGVCQPWRRQGLGTALLIRHSKNSTTVERVGQGWLLTQPASQRPPSSMKKLVCTSPSSTTPMKWNCDLAKT